MVSLKTFLNDVILKSFLIADTTDLFVLLSINASFNSGSFLMLGLSANYILLTIAYDPNSIISAIVNILVWSLMSAGLAFSSTLINIVGAMNPNIQPKGLKIEVIATTTGLEF